MNLILVMLVTCHWYKTGSLDVCGACCAVLSGGQGGMAARVAWCGQCVVLWG